MADFVFPVSRRAFVDLNRFIEALVISVVLAILIVGIPILLEKAGATSKSSNVLDDPPITRLSIASERKQLWIQRGAELVAVDLVNNQTEDLVSSKTEGDLCGKMSRIGDWGVSRDGNTFLVTNNERELLIYRNREIVVSEGFPSVTTLFAALSSDGKTAVRISGAKAVRCWDLSTEDATSFEFTLSEAAMTIGLSSVNRRLVVSTLQGSLQIYDLNSGKLSATVSDNDSICRRLVISDDGRWLAAAGGQSLIVCDMQSGEMTWKGHTPKLSGFHSLAVSPDGKWVAASALGDGIRIMDIITGECRYHLPTDDDRHRIDFTASSNGIYSGTISGMIHEWSLEGEEIKRFQLHSTNESSQIRYVKIPTEQQSP